MGGNQNGSPEQEEFLAGGGEMGERVRAFDWSSHPIGPASTWPQSLRSALSICLNSGFPIALYWGSDLRLLYNDEWSPILGGKHPWALGHTARETWPEIWNIIEPLFAQVLTTGQATRSRDQLLPMNRHGFTEECYFDYTFTPIRGESGKVDGIFNAVLETTMRVVGERRLKTLRELAARTTEEARSAEQACCTAAQFLAANPYDLPFAGIYLLSGEGRATLCGQAGSEAIGSLLPPEVSVADPDQAWPWREVVESGRATFVGGLSAKFGALPVGPWPEALEQAVVLPLSAPGHTQLAGFVLAGISPRLALNDDYRTFLDLLAGHIAASIANARAHEEEKKRAEALAELDRAKTAFFSNVSHEFRTPLTLMLGPVEELLARSHTDLPPAAAGQLEVVNRNGMRLLRLVNTLLDFSRIEAGRVRATFQPTDLAALTADLASSFRSACERAGLRLVVHCPPLAEPVFVDREMWEKVVLNLLSNAFKFTFDGEIAITLRRDGDHAELRVRDTGTGIPAEEIPKLFERFHRIENTRGRTHEGSGIGLALVQELVKLHHGTVQAESTLGQGTTFTVNIPLGQAHLPADQIGEARRALAAGLGSSPFVEEALRWLPASPQNQLPEFPVRRDVDLPTASPLRAESDDRPRVLVADDNADLRQYIARLLSEQFQVEVAPDGEAALAAAKERVPDLVLTDVMMPRLDGFGLLQALRADPQTSQLPIVMLSARAGEESRVEGLEAGADDYLIKPFSARELLARVTAHIQMARLRRDAERAVRESDERLRVTFASIGDAVLTTNTAGCITNINPVAESLTGWSSSEANGRPLEEVFHIVNETTRQRVENPAARALREGVVVGLANHTVLIAKDGTCRPIDDSAAPIRTKEGDVIGSVLVFRDVTERRAAEKRLRDRELRYRLVGHAANDAIWDWDLITNEVAWNEGVRRVFGYREQDIGSSAAWWVENIHPEDRERITTDIHNAIDGGQEFWQNEYRYRRADGTYAAVYDRGQVVREDGKPVRMVGSMLDLTERKQAEAALKASEERFAFVRKSSGVGFWYCDLPFDVLQWDENVKTHFHLPADAPVTIDTFYERIHPDDREPTRAAIERSVVQRVPYDVFYRTIAQHSSEEKWIRAIGRTFYDADDRAIRFDGVTLDLTAQKRSEEQLASELEAVTRLHGLSSRLLAAADLSLALQDVLENALQTCRADFGNIQLLDRQNQSLAIIAHQGFPDEFLDYFRKVSVDEGSACAQAMRAGRRIMIEDVELDPTFEPHRPIAARTGYRAVQSTPLKAHDGAIIGMLSTHFRDPHRISPRDERLLDLYARHAADLIERLQMLADLREVAAALSEAGHRKDEFLATLAHELRNPLAPLRNALELMQLSPDQDVQSHARSLMERQLSQMVRLIDDLMDVSRITRGKLDLRKEQAPLSMVINSAVETSRPLIEQMRHTLHVSLPAQPVLIEADVTRLAQVFGNLLNNAAKYSEPGGRIEVSADVRGNEVLVRVRDTGIGIAADHLPHIFEMFTQVERSLERSQGGLGIGLTLVRRLVQLHGGSVEATSAGPGQGSEFIVRLPRLIETSKPLADGAKDHNTPKSSLRILIVDDNRDGADSLSLMLNFIGNDTRTAYDGEQGVEFAANYRPDVILFDIGLPKLNGFEACRRIREQSWGSEPIIIAITGWGQDEDRRRSQEAGFDHHLVKPVDPRTLMQLLATLKRP